MKKHAKQHKTQSFRKLLSKCKPTDFDGHTDFQKLTPKQKLIWLSKMAPLLWLGKTRGKKK